MLQCSFNIPPLRSGVKYSRTVRMEKPLCNCVVCNSRSAVARQAWRSQIEEWNR